MTTTPERGGPRYDRMMRRIVEEGNFPGFCAWLGVQLKGEPQFVAGNFPSETLYTDLLARISPDRLLHMEYMVRPAADVPVRMLGYRAQIMRRYAGKQVTQIAIVLGDGHLRDLSDPETGFRLGLRTVHVRDADPQALLADPALAPMAVLTRGTREARQHRLAQALIRIRKEPPNRRSALVEASLELARIVLDRPTIDQIRKETKMTVEETADFYSESDWAKVLKDRGRQEGRQEGLRTGQARTLLALMRTRFGDHPSLDALAEELSQADEAVAIEAITRANRVEDVRLP